MRMSTLGKVLLEKLTKSELKLFCTAFDDGALDDIIYDELMPVDRVNFPEDYADPDDSDICDAQE